MKKIVGSIKDETDIVEEELDITQCSENEFIVQALTPIEDFNDYFGTTISKENFDTIDGYIMQ
ncbi:transporter associated domain-containing protein [Coxiella-like endosymbiont]|uniref:transporter associated domain-containing protein n=1 Tax=Coxiella-like endosymbiont TaxID=1592897 RepID=UPI00272D2972|nr:transporter associated domain-containing protein [Coxiella-like endosymbiont]